MKQNYNFHIVVSSFILQIKIALLEVSAHNRNNNYGPGCEKTDMARVNARRQERRRIHWHKTKGDADSYTQSNREQVETFSRPRHTRKGK